MSTLRFDLRLVGLLLFAGTLLISFYSAALRTAAEVSVIDRITISPGLRYLARSSNRGLSIWDLKTGAPALIRSPDAYFPEFMHDGRECVFFERGVHSWRVADGTVSRKFVIDDSSGVRHAALARDGQSLLVDWHGTIERMELNGGAILQSATIQQGFAYAEAATGDLGRAAVGNAHYPGYQIAVWDLRTSQLLHKLTGAKYISLHQLRFSPDGTQLAAAMGDAVRVWDVESGNIRGLLPASEACAIDFSPDGGRLAVLENDGRVRVWPVGGEAGEAGAVGKLGAGWSGAVRFAPDGKQLAAADERGEVRIWDLPDRNVELHRSGLHLRAPAPAPVWWGLGIGGVIWSGLWLANRRAVARLSGPGTRVEGGWYLVTAATLLVVANGLMLVSSELYLPLPAIFAMALMEPAVLLALPISLIAVRYNVLCLLYAVVVLLTAATINVGVIWMAALAGA